MQKRLMHVLAATALAAAPVAAFQSSATAQEYPGGGAGESEFAPGQQTAASAPSGTFTAGSSGNTVVRGEGATRGSAVAVVALPVDTWVAAADGSARTSFVMPELAPGSAAIVFQGTKDGRPASFSVPIEIVAPTYGTGGTGTGGDTDGAGAGGGGTAVDGSILPRTGADAVVPLLATGIALVLAGGGVLVVARKRREDLDQITLA